MIKEKDFYLELQRLSNRDQVYYWMVVFGLVAAFVGTGMLMYYVWPLCLLAGGLLVTYAGIAGLLDSHDKLVSRFKNK